MTKERVERTKVVMENVSSPEEDSDNSTGSEAHSEKTECSTEKEVNAVPECSTEGEVSSIEEVDVAVQIAEMILGEKIEEEEVDPLRRRRRYRKIGDMLSLKELIFNQQNKEE